MDSWKLDAEQMVREQIMTRGVAWQPVLEAMGSVPRHLFLEKPLDRSAWIDSPLPIGDDQTISQPYMVARMTELLAPQPGDAVLEVGTGSGYQTAVLAALGARVTSMERIRALAERAREKLGELAYPATVLWLDGREKPEEPGFFSGVLVTAAVDELADWWSEVLLPGGRLVAPLRVASGSERLFKRIKREEGAFEDSWHEYCRFVPLLRGRADGRP